MVHGSEILLTNPSETFSAMKKEDIPTIPRVRQDSDRMKATVIQPRKTFSTSWKVYHKQERTYQKLDLAPEPLRYA